MDLLLKYLKSSLNYSTDIQIKRTEGLYNQEVSFKFSHIYSPRKMDSIFFFYSHRHFLKNIYPFINSKYDYVIKHIIIEYDIALFV
jgi:hypothetical protein